MNSIAEVMDDVAVTDSGQRYHHWFSVYVRGRVTEEQYQRVLYAVMQQFWMKGEYRTNRPQPTAGYSHAVSNSNAGDKRWMEKMAEFKNEFGLEMTPFEDIWYEYLMTGEISDEVRELILL